MSKTTTSIRIDGDVFEQAKEKFINVSAVTEKALREKLGKQDVEIDHEIDHCEQCNKKDRKATKDDLKGLTWLWPNEMWVCESCLGTQVRISVSSKK